MDLLQRQGRAGCARCVAISRRNQDVITPARVFNMLDICLDRVKAAQPTQLLNGLTRRRWLIAQNCSRGNYRGRIALPSATYITKTAKFRFRRQHRYNIAFETVFRLRRWQWTSTRAAPRRCYVEAAVCSRRLDRGRKNLGATIVTMKQLQWISRGIVTLCGLDTLRPCRYERYQDCNSQ